MKPIPKVKGRSRAWRFQVLAMLLIAAAAILFFDRTQRQPAMTPDLKERSRNELELRDGRLLDKDLPFTGFVLEHYGGGNLKSRSSVSNGLLEGLSEGWYTNGVLQVTEHFNKGVSNGLRTKYYENGGKLSVANIVNGAVHGIYRRWHENGALSEQVNLTNGVPDGEALSFFPDGSLKARVRLDRGRVMEQKFSKLGEAR